MWLWLLARQDRFVLMFVLLLLLWVQYTHEQHVIVDLMFRRNKSKITAAKLETKVFRALHSTHQQSIGWLAGKSNGDDDYQGTIIVLPEFVPFIFFRHSERNEKRHCERKESLYNFAEKCISLEHPKTFQMVINVLLPFLWLEFSRYTLHRTANVQKNST